MTHCLLQMEQLEQEMLQTKSSALKENEKKMSELQTDLESQLQTKSLEMVSPPNTGVRQYCFTLTVGTAACCPQD